MATTPFDDRIFIDDLLLRGVVGIDEWEQRVVQDILVSAVLWLDLTAIGRSDRVDDGVNYATIAQEITTHVESARRHTVEALATDVAGICLAHERVLRARVRVRKPAANRFARGIGAEIERDRTQLMQAAAIVLGSNESGEVNLPRAVRELPRLGRVVAVSPVYQTKAVGGGAGQYLNAAVRMDTCLPAAALLRGLKTIEREMGRGASGAAKERVPIDLDLALVGDQVVDAADVRVPAPEVLTAAHFAVPLADVAPDVRHPQSGETMATIAERLRAGAAFVRRPDVDLRQQLHS